MTDLATRHPGVDIFLLKKWERIFSIFFDRNSSDDITSADFYIVLRQARNIYGSDSAQMTYASASMKALWDKLKSTADKNSDEKITVDEWITVLKGTTEKKTEDPWFNEYQGFMFKLMDVSDDKVLDLAEYTDGMHCYGYKDAECHEAFKKFCVDKSGKPLNPPTLDKNQFKDLWNQYFFSTDKAAVGNHLFGILPADF